MTRTLALEWGAHGIRVNGVAPGPIAGTPGLTKLAGGALDAGALEEMVAEVIPLGRMGEKRDIGTVVVFLCCNGSGRYAANARAERARERSGRESEASAKGRRPVGGATYMPCAGGGFSGHVPPLTHLRPPEAHTCPAKPSSATAARGFGSPLSSRLTWWTPSLAPWRRKKVNYSAYRE